MKFGPIPVDEAKGAITAHALRLTDLSLKKGHVISAEDQRRLIEAGITTVIAARLEPGDVPEDEAAHRLAQSIAGAGLRIDRPFTGRVNLFADANGLALIDVDAIARINQVHESVTVATVPRFHPAAAGDMVGTVKIIPFAAPGAAINAACAVGGRSAIAIAPYRAQRIGVISTLLPGLKASVIAKTLKVLEDRLAPSGSLILMETRVAHDAETVAFAIDKMAPHCDALILFGASAITDRRDVIPTAIERSGGRIEHFGMPVDPGNLLLLARRGEQPILGAPGCARSPKENGFDWVLSRLLADVPISRADIQGMGVGGLLMEIASRPQPRLGDE